MVPDGNDLRAELLMLHHDSPLAGHLGLYCMSWGNVVFAKLPGLL